MARAFLFVLDSFGIGHAPDAVAFGNAGADTFGNIEAACAEGRGDREGLRRGPLKLPNMKSLGLAHAAALSAGRNAASLGSTTGFYGAASERSLGKDTPSGHWEIAGVPVPFAWNYFPESEPTFPLALTQAIIEKAELPGILGNCHASGTEIIARLGAEHIRSGKPICYTSADSVFQVAAHERHFGLERLYALCEIVRELVDPLNIGRVIARPFIGENEQEFERTANRRDYAVPPPEPTLLDRVEAAGGRVIGIGKIGDIFAHQGVSEVRKAAGNMALFEASLKAMEDARDGDLVFANFVDFDTLYGHRRDVPGYAAALEAFDRRLPHALALMREGDMLILTADHGCDPTWSGTDHTRERVPVIGASPDINATSVGVRATFADIGETIAEHLDLPAGRHGTSFLSELANDA
ncbi:phosphopentomutase [Nitratireductor pacificus]|uniref:Phosphopentomutase n=1 Tax=Nitratireductor pacificus pht-3B TaxID=391937 RepID=K2N5I9_9HYPH|nr:phosphopentomutase [Nitratireductor pacificus]EKF19463.1 phosphopentomutase [Nitratireductor pacificus pht-3B]